MTIEFTRYERTAFLFDDCAAKVAGTLRLRARHAEPVNSSSSIMASVLLIVEAQEQFDSLPVAIKERVLSYLENSAMAIDLQGINTQHLS